MATAAAHRRQGLGALALALAADRAFAAGAEVAFLTPGGDGSRRRRTSAAASGPR